MIVWSFKILIMIILALINSFWYIVSLSIPIKKHDFCQTPLYNSRVTRFENWTIFDTFFCCNFSCNWSPTKTAMETVKGSIKSCHTVQIKFPFEVVSGMYKETRNKYKIYGTLIQPEKNRWAYIYNTVILKGPINYLWQGVIQKTREF